MLFHLLYHFLLLLLLATDGVQLCPKQCDCNNSAVFCQRKGLRRIPANIPANTTRLDLRYNFMKRMSKADLYGLKNLETLFLTHNRLRLVDEVVFFNHKSLGSSIVFRQPRAVVTFWNFLSSAPLKCIYEV